ncbi:hypothetical protein [Spirosoma litoris]
MPLVKAFEWRYATKKYDTARQLSDEYPIKQGGDLSIKISKQKQV